MPCQNSKISRASIVKYFWFALLAWKDGRDTVVVSLWRTKVGTCNSAANLDKEPRYVLQMVARSHRLMDGPPSAPVTNALREFHFNSEFPRSERRRLTVPARSPGSGR